LVTTILGKAAVVEFCGQAKEATKLEPEYPEAADIPIGQLHNTTLTAVSPYFLIQFLEIPSV
jgi:hypothetical protein